MTDQTDAVALQNEEKRDAQQTEYREEGIRLKRAFRNRILMGLYVKILKCDDNTFIPVEVNLGRSSRNTRINRCLLHEKRLPLELVTITSIRE